jgi:hypothetical protein
MHYKVYISVLFTNELLNNPSVTQIGQEMADLWFRHQHFGTILGELRQVIFDYENTIMQTYPGLISPDALFSSRLDLYHTMGFDPSQICAYLSRNLDLSVRFMLDFYPN